MKSILSIALATVMMLTVMTGCGNKKNNNVTTTNPPATATQAPAATTAPMTTETPDGTDGVMNDMVDRVENGANDVVNGVENAVDDVLGDDGVVNGELDDGRVTDENTVEPRTNATNTR